MFGTDSSSVSSIHRRWLFTRLNPSSHKTSYALSLLGATILSILFYVAVIRADISTLLLHVGLGLTVLTGSVFLDFHILHGAPLNKIAKGLHVSAFAFLLWAFTVLIGVFLHTMLSKTGSSTSYVVEGMLLAVGVRIGIFMSVFGAGFMKSVLAAFVQPVVFLFAILPFSSFGTLFSAGPGILYGSVFVILPMAWATLADRGGRPNVESTFKLLQAFLAAWTENRSDMMEEIAEARAQNEKVITYIARFNLADSQASIILPDLHPGPFNPIGGSNLPYLLYSEYSRNALILHSVSNHSRNIPSKTEVRNYIRALAGASVSERSDTSTVPVKVKVGRSTATGIIFGSTAIVILSMAPTGMEDVPEKIRVGLEEYSSRLGLKHILVIDSHNAMGEELMKSDAESLLSAGKSCLKELTNALQYEFKAGFANLDDISVNAIQMEELGQSGLATFVVEVKGLQYVIGWADSNNMDNDLRDHIITKLSANGIQTLELCTSDTHSTSGKRTQEGYYALGKVSNHDEIAEMYLRLSKKSIEKASAAKFELLSSTSTIKVMGYRQFDDYAAALDRSMNITKVFLAVTCAAFCVILVLS